MVRHLVQVLSNLGLVSSLVHALVCCSNNLLTTAFPSQRSQQVKQFLLPQLFSQFHVNVLHFVALVIMGSRFRGLYAPVYHSFPFRTRVSIPAFSYCASQSEDRKQHPGTVLALTNFSHQCLDKSKSLILCQQKRPGCSNTVGGLEVEILGMTAYEKH